MGEFGDKFRKAREKKGASLDDASNATKIGSRMLQAIEEEEFDRLPGGVFNKGFIRAYAKHLGLNDEEAVSEYLECLRQAQIAAQAAWQPPSRTATPSKFAPATSKPTSKPTPAIPPSPPPSTRVEDLPDLQLPRAEHVRPPRPAYPGRKPEIPWRIVAVAALIVVLAVVLWNRHVRIERSHAATASETAPPAPQPSASTATSPAAGPASSMPASSTPSSPSPQPPSSMTAPPASSTQQRSSMPQSSQADTESDQSTSAMKHPVTAQPAPEPPLWTLVIRATENTWISVSADGQTASQETLIAPAATSVRAKREVVVRVGNAAGVSFLLNGKEIAPQGNESEVKTLVFDSSGLKSDSGQPPPTGN